MTSALARIRHAIPARTFGVLCVLLAVMVWSGWIVLSSYSVRGTLTAYDITALRFGTAGLLLLPVLIKKGLRLGPWGIFGGFFLACMMGAPYNTITIYAMKFAPASHAAGIINTAMLSLTTLAGIFLLREGTSPLRLLGLGLSIIGISCLLASDNGAPGSHDDMLLGHLLFLLGGAIWAVYAITAKRWHVDPLHATASVCVCSAIMYLPIYFAFLPSNIGMHNINEAVFQGAYQGILNSIIALLCYNNAIRMLGASTSSAFLPLIPVISTLIAIPALGEVPGPFEWVGIALAACGVLLSTGMISRMLIARRCRHQHPGDLEI